MGQGGKLRMTSRLDIYRNQNEHTGTLFNAHSLTCSDGLARAAVAWKSLDAFALRWGKRMSDAGDLPEMDDEYLNFLHDEGLDMLAAFRAIRKKEKRDLIVELAKAIAESQSNSSDVG